MGIYCSKITQIISVSHSLLSQIRKEECAALEQKAQQWDVAQFPIFVLLSMIKGLYLHQSKSYHVALADSEWFCVDFRQSTALRAGFKSKLEPLYLSYSSNIRTDQYPIACRQVESCFKSPIMFTLRSVVSVKDEIVDASAALVNFRTVTERKACSCLQNKLLSKKFYIIMTSFFSLYDLNQTGFSPLCGHFRFSAWLCKSWVGTGEKLQFWTLESCLGSAKLKGFLTKDI